MGGRSSCLKFSGEKFRLHCFFFPCFYSLVIEILYSPLSTITIKCLKFLSNCLTRGTLHLSEAGEYVDAFIQGSIIGSLKFF